MGDWAVKVSPLPVFCWLSYWNVTLPACWRSLLQAGGTACWQRERHRALGAAGRGEGDVHNGTITGAKLGKQNTVLCWGHTHTHPSTLQEASTSICPSIHSLVQLNQFNNFPSIHQHIFLSIHQLTAICLSVCLSTHLSIHLSTYILSLLLISYLSVYLTVI